MVDSICNVAVLFEVVVAFFLFVGCGEWWMVGCGRGGGVVLWKRDVLELVFVLFLYFESLFDTIREQRITL